MRALCKCVSFSWLISLAKVSSGEALAFEELKAGRRKDSVAAAMTVGCCEDSVCVDGRVVGRWNFSFLEEVILELASEWRNRMG